MTNKNLITLEEVKDEKLVTELFEKVIETMDKFNEEAGYLKNSIDNLWYVEGLYYMVDDLFERVENLSKFHKHYNNMQQLVDKNAPLWHSDTWVLNVLEGEDVSRAFYCLEEIKGAISGLKADFDEIVDMNNKAVTCKLEYLTIN